MEQNKCWLCGSTHDNIAFKKGFVCEECIEYIKSDPGELKEKDKKKNKKIRKGENSCAQTDFHETARKAEQE